MKTIFFIFLLIFSLSANPLLVLEKKVNQLDLSLNQQANQYVLNFDLNPTNENSTTKSSYYVVSFDDLLKVRKINQYKTNNRNQEKMTLEIVFFPDEKIQYLKEVTIDNLRQEREFDKQGYLIKDAIFFARDDSKSKTYDYDEQGNLVNVKYYENQLLISQKKISIINQTEKKIDFFDAEEKLYRYQIQKKNGNSKSNYEKTITDYSPLGEKILARKEYYTNSLLKKIFVENQKEIDYFYNDKNQLTAKSIKSLTSNHQQKFRYFYSANPQKSYLLFNPYFRINSLIEQKNYWEEELSEETFSLKNYYQDLVAFSNLEKKNNQTRKVHYQFFIKGILAYHYENDKIMKKEIYDNFGQKKSEDIYNYYINGFLASREFRGLNFIRKRKIIFFYKELPLNKNGYEICKNNQHQAEIMDFNFANVLFERLYLIAKNSSSKKVSFQKDFLDFKNRLLNESSSNKKVLEKLSFIETCRINKMVITNQNNDINSYARVVFDEKKQEKKVVFNYYQEPNFDYLEKYDRKFYQKNYPPLIENTAHQEQTEFFFDEKQGFLNRANDQIAAYKEKIRSQFVFHYHTSNQLIFAQKNCYDASGEKIGSIFIYPKSVILDKNQRCRVASTLEN